MRKIFLAALMAAALAPAAAAGDVLRMPGAGPAYDGPLPGRGQTMAAVESRFGAPRQRHLPAGGGKPEHPPITRWDYSGFSVFFENDRVLHAVVPSSPPEVHHRERLVTDHNR